MAGEEAVQITATATQKAMEVSVELMKAIVFPTLKTIGGFAKKAQKRSSKTSRSPQEPAMFLTMVCWKKRRGREVRLLLRITCSPRT